MFTSVSILIVMLCELLVVAQVVLVRVLFRLSRDDLRFSDLEEIRVCQACVGAGNSQDKTVCPKFHGYGIFSVNNAQEAELFAVRFLFPVFAW